MINSKLFLFALLTFASMSAVTSTPAHAAPATPKEWTFMVFLNGHNNLDTYGDLNLNEMEKVGSTDKVNVVVQWASYSASTTRRLLVQKDSDTEKVTSPVVQELPRVDMGDVNEFVNFVRWSKENYPAKHYFAVIWNHGSGWHFQEMGQDIHAKDISYDDYTNHFITTEQLGHAMDEIKGVLGQKLDIYGSDACLMAMAEVADEMADSVSYFVGSQELEPGEGWPYDKILEGWKKASDLSAANFSKILVEEYTKSYQGGSHGTSDATMSAYDLGQLAPLRQTLSQLSAHFVSLAPNEIADVYKASTSALSFDNGESDYVDLGDFVKTVHALRPDVLADDHLTAVNQALANFVIAMKNTSRYTKATGVSVWIPAYSDTFQGKRERYSGLKFNQHTNWLQFLDHMSGSMNLASQSVIPLR